MNVLFLLNIGLDLKYLIEPFDEGSDVLELKRIAIEQANSYFFNTIITLSLFFSFIFLNWFFNRK